MGSGSLKLDDITTYTYREAQFGHPEIGRIWSRDHAHNVTYYDAKHNVTLRMTKRRFGLMQATFVLCCLRLLIGVAVNAGKLST